MRTLHRWVRVLGVATALSTVWSCATHYSNALGYRARRAALEKNHDAFPQLMEEAAQSAPQHKQDDPKKTVLTHYLDLADHPDFFTNVEKWRAQGWVSSDMDCDIYRAHHRESHKRTPDAARKSARAAIALARKAAETPGRKWEVKQCLEEASFLVETSTTELVPYLRHVIDDAEPKLFRRALLDGMSRVYITGKQRRIDNDPDLDAHEAHFATRKHAHRQAKRLRFIVESVAPYSTVQFMAAGTSRGVLEVENVSVPLGESFIGAYALSARPYERDLAWAWVRHMKAQKKISRILGLGLWNRNKEPKADAFWYLCAADPKTAELQQTTLGPLLSLDAALLRTSETESQPRKVASGCRAQDARLVRVFGPFPTAATARGHATHKLRSALPNATREHFRLNVRHRGPLP